VQVLLIDNYDSFTFNLVDDFRRRGVKVEVWRNDLGLERARGIIAGFGPERLIVVSPGPGRPEDAGCCVELIRELGPTIPIFGVCLGLQALVTAFGGVVGPAGEVVHGKSCAVVHDGNDIFFGLSRPLKVGRYHSLVATSLGHELEQTASFGGLVMAVRHRRYPVRGVQFHPESILTAEGGALLENVINWARENGCGRTPAVATKGSP
jgi:anthranilate synthase/aminodeoxychorismate synthase-like glutamine amidotransferase